MQCIYWPFFRREIIDDVFRQTYGMAVSETVNRTEWSSTNAFKANTFRSASLYSIHHSRHYTVVASSWQQHIHKTAICSIVWYFTKGEALVANLNVHKVESKFPSSEMWCENTGSSSITHCLKSFSTFRRLNSVDVSNVKWTSVMARLPVVLKL